MIRAKNYETVFKFVKVMPIILLASFFPDTVYKCKCLHLYGYPTPVKTAQSWAFSIWDLTTPGTPYEQDKMEEHCTPEAGSAQKQRHCRQAQGNNTSSL